MPGDELPDGEFWKREYGKDAEFWKEIYADDPELLRFDQLVVPEIEIPDETAAGVAERERRDRHRHLLFSKAKEHRRLFTSLNESFPVFPLGSPNDQMGPNSVTWNMPRATTCRKEWPDGQTIATEVCMGCCYVTGFENQNPAYNDALRRADAIRKLPDFPELFVAMCDQKEYTVRLVRIHSSGDFDSVAYIESWIEITKLMLRVPFLAYTRSWRRPELIDALTRLSEQPNMMVHWSYDTSSGMPPSIPGAKTAPLLDRSDRSPALRGDNKIAFRANQRRNHVELEWVRAGELRCRVCPHEDGVTPGQKRLPCQYCKICLPNEKAYGS